MNELKRHIEVLLLQNECVIVPDFGGFMAHQVCARYDEDECIFLPPMRTIGFNPQLRMNDSLLVQSYVETYDISYPEALRRIEDEVGLLRRQLDNEGHYTLDGLGELTVNAEGNYEFSPCAAGILSPELYGLDTFSFRRLGDTAPIAEEISVTTDIAGVSDASLEEEAPAPNLLDFTDNGEDDERTISIKMSWIRNAVAVAAAVVAFFLIATPVANSDLGSTTLSQMKSNVLYRLLPQDTNMTPSYPIRGDEMAENSTATAETKAENKSVAESVADSVATAPGTMTEAGTDTKNEAPYTIVLASQVKKSNAEYFVEQLHKAGHRDARVYIHNNIVRVVYGDFKTQAEAYEKLNSLHGEHDFEEAWVYKKAAV